VASPVGSLRDALVIVAAGAALTIILGRPIVRTWIARRWPRAPGTVTETKLEAGGGNVAPETSRRFVAVSYRYTIDGATLVGQRFSFLSRRITRARYMQAKDEAARYKKGTSVDVRYDPKDPANAVISTDIPWHWKAIGGFSALFLALGLVGLIRILLH
jgi:hypothetical protein